MPVAVVDTRPIAADLYLYAGDTVTLHIDVTDTLGAPVDLAGYTAEAQIRASADAPTSVDFTAVAAGSAVDLTMDAADTATLPAKGVWDVQIVSGTGATTTLAAGKVTVTAEVTR